MLETIPTSPQPDDPEAELRAVFNAFDDDKSNHISMKEVSKGGRCGRGWGWGLGWGWRSAMVEDTRR